MKKLIFLSAIALSTTAFAQINKPQDDFFSLTNRMNAGKTGAQIIRESDANYARFVALDVNAIAHPNISRNDDTRGKPTSLSVENARKVLQTAMDHEVVSLDKYSKYDAQNKGIGFCFGRAMFIDTYLSLAGFHRANIKKAFVVGPMSGGSWGWHVSTIVQSTDRAGNEMWLALDPVAGSVMDVKAWYKKWQGSSDDGKLRLLIAERTKFGAGSSWYDENQISNPFYNNYFKDMMRWFGRNDVSDDLSL